MTLTSVLLAVASVTNSRTILHRPGPYEEVDSVHVLAFTSQGELLVAESEGSFTIDDWEELHGEGKRICHDQDQTEDDNAMQHGEDVEDGGEMMRFVKSVLKEKVQKDLHWRE